MQEDVLQQFLNKEEQRTEENKSQVIETCKRIVNLELEKKALNDNIKELKKQLKDTGVDLKAFNMALKKIKEEINTAPDVAYETDKIVEEIKGDLMAYGSIKELVQK